MRRIAIIAVVAASLTPLPALADAPVVVWIAARGAQEEAVFPIAAGWVEDLRILVVREEVDAPPDALEAERTLLAHRALAVVWHDAGGALRVALAADGRPEHVAVPAGGLTEEGLYLRELFAARLAAGSFVAAALVTVPDEIVATRTRPPDDRPIPLVPMDERARRLPALGVKLGAGYTATAHFDDVVWWQHGMRLVAPSLRLAELVEVSLALELGMPVEIGIEDRASLELRTIAVTGAVSVFPLRRARVEIEAGLGVGPLRTDVVAFLPDGSSERAEDTAGHLTATVAVVFHPAPHVDLRARIDARYAIRPTGYGIGGRGDFGAYPWQPSGGIDLAFALFGR